MLGDMNLEMLDTDKLDYEENIGAEGVVDVKILFHIPVSMG